VIHRFWNGQKVLSNDGHDLLFLNQLNQRVPEYPCFGDANPPSRLSVQHRSGSVDQCSYGLQNVTQKCLGLPLFCRDETETIKQCWEKLYGTFGREKSAHSFPVKFRPTAFVAIS
jgi:hypothetical protein